MTRKQFLEAWIDKPFEGDALVDFLPHLPKDSIDGAVTSPPYPQGGKGKGRRRPPEDSARFRGTMARREHRGMRPAEDLRRYARRGTAAEQREQIDAFHHGRPELKGETGLAVRIAAPDWLDWWRPFAKQVFRVLKPGASFVVNVDTCVWDRKTKHWGVYSLPERMTRWGWCFADCRIWAKPNGAPVTGEGRVRHSWEFVYHFAKGRDWMIHGASLAERDLFTDPVGLTRWEKYGGVHSAAMPESLARKLVTFASKPGDIVLDPFLGSGTTMAAAIALGRHGLGAELLPAAAAIARRRVAQALGQIPLIQAREVDETASLFEGRDG